VAVLHLHRMHRPVAHRSRRQTAWA
jgi:hypothetical protein